MRKFLVGSAVLIAAFLLIWKLNFLTVNNVKVISSAECVDSENLKREVNLLGKNLIFLDTSEVEKKIQSKYLCVKSVEVKYEFPKTIIINCFGRTFLSKIIAFTPALTFINQEASISSQTALIDTSFPASSDEASFIVDETGFIFKQNEGELLPVTFIDKNIALGEQLNAEVFKKIPLIFKTLFNNLPGFDIKNSRVKLYQDYIIIDSNLVIIFDTKGDILKQLASLQLILQEAKINQGTLKSIDLRFNKAVVTYQSK